MRVIDAELGAGTRKHVRELWSALERKGIDLKQARIERVERWGDRIDSVEMQLVEGAVHFRIGFQVLAFDGYELMSIEARIE